MALSLNLIIMLMLGPHCQGVQQLLLAHPVSKLHMIYLLAHDVYLSASVNM
jgi:hypothetical protein